MVLNFFSLLWYNPTLDRECPPWVYATWAVGLWLYQTFDAVDGIQAYVFVHVSQEEEEEEEEIVFELTCSI